MNSILYQGTTGSYSHITAQRLFGEAATYIGLETFRDVFTKLREGMAQVAVLPLENSLVGTIYEVFDLLYQEEVSICDEQYTKVDHCLLGKSTSLEGIKKVLSHPKALEQCSRFFQEHPWMEPVVHYDTAAAAKELSLLKNPEYAAIASKPAGALYGLDILKQDIQDAPNNYTRFGIITTRPVTCCQATKCSCILRLEHVPGALAQVLTLFANERMNVTKIESRPIHNQPFEYLFYLDVEFKKRQQFEKILHDLRGQVPMIKILGYYNGCHKKNTSAN